MAALRAVVATAAEAAAVAAGQREGLADQKAAAVFAAAAAVDWVVLV